MKTLAFVVAFVLSSAAFAYSSFTLVRAEPTNGGLVCVYSNGQHEMRIFRPFSAGYCPFYPS